MKTLVVYYSFTGNTKKIAEKISKMLNADIDEIIIEGHPKPFQKENIEIKYKKNSKDYDLVIVGTPVWGLKLTPAVKQYFIENGNKIKKIAFFCTCGEMHGWTFRKMKKLSQKPVAVLSINRMRLNSPDDKIKKFCEKLK